MDTTESLPPILHSKLFSVLQDTGIVNGFRTLTVRCELCQQKSLEHKITGYNNSTINYKKHLKLEHADELKKYEDETVNAQKVIVGTLDGINNNIVNYMIDEVLSIDNLTNKNFQKIFSDINEEYVILNEESFFTKTKNIYSAVLDDLINILIDVEYVALTFDALTVRNLNVFLITAHWLDSQTYERKSILISNKIEKDEKDAQINCSTMSCYVLKICEQFKLYQDRLISLTFNSVKKSSFQFQDLNYAYNRYNFVSIFDADSFGNIPFEITTSPDTILELNCASNVLLQMAIVELKKSIPEMYFSIHQSTFQKCVRLWKIKHVNNKDNSVSWSTYINFLIELLNTNPETDTFNESEQMYLEEFLEITKCLLKATESLNQDRYYHYGYLLPVLLKLKEDLKECTRNYIYFTHSIMHMTELLDCSFEKLLNFSGRESDQAIIACSLHPKIKLKWISRTRFIENTPMNMIQLVTQKCILAVQKVSSKLETLSTIANESAKTNPDFDAMIMNVASMGIEDEVKNYLLDRGHTFDVLKKYPNVQKAFIQYNTPMCVSKPIINLLTGSKFFKAFSADYSSELFEMIPVINAFNFASLS